MTGLLDFEGQLALYKAYHLHPKNVQIHLVFIPVIFYTGIILARFISLKVSEPAIAIYAIYYLLLNFKVGLVSLPFLFLLEYLCIKLVKWFDPLLVFRVALSLHIFGWIVQFIGHGKFEKKSPAVFDNLVQPLVLAPYFVLIEVLFMFGYDPDLEKRITKLGKQIRREVDSKSFSKHRS